MRKFIFGFALGLLPALAFDDVYPSQAMLQAVPMGEGVTFEIKVHRAWIGHDYVIPKFVVPVHDGSDEGLCPSYSVHWYGLCIPY